MLSTRASFFFSVALASELLACEPSIESNASDPSGGVYWASETTMVHFRFAGQDRLALGYIDQESFQRLDGTLLPRPTAAGLSLSKDAGRTWTKLPPLQTDPPSCTGPTCVRALIADPWIATNGTFLNYAFMGSTIGFGSQTDTFVVSLSSDAENWTQPIVAVQRLGHQVDKDSISMSGSTSAMVFTELRTPQNNSRLGMATSESNGALGWVDQGDLIVPVATSLDWPHSPLIQLVSQTEGYIAYVAFTVGASSAFAVHVVRITARPRVRPGRWQARSSAARRWNSQTCFRRLRPRLHRPHRSRMASRSASSRCAASWATGST